MSVPEVTVVIATRDRAALLARALRAVSEQGVEVEVIVVDDGSSDGTPALLAALGGAGVRVVRHDRSRGVAAARNAGVDLASAPLLAFCDDDDVWAPVKLRAQLDALEDRRAGWCAVGDVWVDSAGNILRGDPPPPSGDVADALLRENSIPGGASGVVARTDLVRAVGGFDTRLQTLADWDLWIRLALESDLASVARPLVAYHVHPGGMSFDTALRRRDIDTMQQKHAATYAARGTSLDVRRQRRYDAIMGLRSGRRLPYAWQRATAAVATRSPGALGAASLSLVSPVREQRRLDARKVELLPAGWAEEVAPWLQVAWAT